MFLHTSCSYSRYVTSSTPALASFRRPSKAAINAAGVSRCASERNRVVLPALASSDNRLSSVDMVLDLGVSPCIPESGRPDVSPFPPVGAVAAPRRALRFPTFAGWGRTTAPPSIHALAPSRASADQTDPGPSVIGVVGNVATTA